MNNSTPFQHNLFTDFPPTIAWLFLAVTLVAMAQFSATEKLAAAFAWLIFVAVLLANGPDAFHAISAKIDGTDPNANTSSGTGGTK